MDREEIIRNELLLTLAERYEHGPGQFVTLSKQTLDSSLIRELVAELRNEGYVEEQMRGVIRLTPRGYHSYKNHSLRFCRGPASGKEPWLFSLSPAMPKLLGGS